jgi:cardiolipin synthase (CMP-forming)
MASKLVFTMNLPNAVSMIRLVMAPVMIALAINGKPHWFIAAVMFSGFTDVMDGYLARKLKQVTEFGSHLDSWGDFAVYSCMAIGAWLLWPDIVIREKFWFACIIASFTLPVIIGLIKFSTLTSYHSYSVKLAVFSTFVGYVSLFGEINALPFRIAAALCLIAGIEEIIITLLMDQEHHDVRTLRQAMQYHKHKS